MRFLAFTYKNPLFRIKGSERQKLKRTSKMILLFGVSLVLFFWIQIFSFLSFNVSRIFFGILLLSIACYPLIIGLASLMIFPLEYGLKTRIVFKAKRKVKQCPNLKVIGITGSYGKTSVKSCLNLLLKDSFEVIAPIGTHNTLLGISQFILKELKPTTQIMIVEMGAYVPGDIKELCDIVNPQYAILTGITLQHLERFGSLDRIIQTKFEITQNLKSDSFLFVDGENENIQKGLERYTQNAPYQKEIISQLPVRYAPDFQGISFIYQGTEYTTKLLGKHTAKNLSLAIAVALKLWIDASTLQQRVEQLPFVEHRLELLYNPKTEVRVLDDSFNGNIEGVKTTVDLLQNTPFEGKKIYLTPWLVELGEKSDEVHLQIGKWLSTAVDRVLLIKNPRTLKIQEGLLDAWYPLSHIVMFDDVLQAHAEVGKYAQKGDIIIFQNDLTDNY